MTSRRELQEGVILAASLTKVVDGYLMTSILNTNDVEVEIQEPLIELDEVNPDWGARDATDFKTRDREREIFTQLRVEHLNSEEKKLLLGTCSAYSDIFYLPGDKLSSTRVVQHSMWKLEQTQ
jgi:hypothetical protein